MAYTRYCRRCAEEVTCREEETEHAVVLFCPECDRRIGTMYGEIAIP